MKAELKPCGTRAAYRRHRRRGEPACADCLRAESVPMPQRARQPCGTPAGHRRHLRRGEDPCAACKAALTRGRFGDRSRAAVPVATRNGMPVTPGYQWRARRYSWAERALARAEAEWGRPEDEEAA